MEQVFVPSFILLLHWRQHIVLYVFHISCAINKKNKLFIFSYLTILIPHIYRFLYHCIICAKCRYFSCTNRALRQNAYLHKPEAELEIELWCCDFFLNSNSIFINRKFRIFIDNALGFKTLFCPVLRYCIMSPDGFFLELYSWSTSVLKCPNWISNEYQK